MQKICLTGSQLHKHTCYQKTKTQYVNPQNYRPIACLSTFYKVLTSILTERSYTHIIKNDIIPEEQRGCARNSFGCKDQLLINKMIIEDCKKKKENLSMAWIDYRKAYDSVPHGWILKTLQI